MAIKKLRSENKLQTLALQAKKIAAVGIMLSASLQANAVLIDRGNGLIYDDYFNITWLADANYAATSGYSSLNQTGANHCTPRILIDQPSHSQHSTPFVH